MSRQKLLMDFDWKFHLGDIEFPPARGHYATYMGSKSERGVGPAAMDYFDSQWENVNLPHDYVIRGDFSPEEEASHGSLAKPIAWYRKGFKIDNADKGKRITLLFDGLGVNSVIYVNGHLMARNFSLYNPVEIDITAVAHYGENLNMISVKIDNSDFEGWWYMGAGIYRHVWMTISDKVCVDTYGVFANAHKMSDDCWNVDIESTIINTYHEDKSVSVVNIILDEDSKEVASDKTEVFMVEPMDKATVNSSVVVCHPAIWDIDDTNLYTVKTDVYLDDALVDTVYDKFGFRTFGWDAVTGFSLNGRNVKLKGNCFHQDFSGYGIGVPDRLQEYKMQLFKDMGSNAVRSAHNLPSTELLDACDSIGLLVMDENRWFNTGVEEQKHVEQMVKRDRNHPSVFIYSVGNEEPIQGNNKGYEITKTLRSVVRKFDKSRPITLALNGGYLSNMATAASDIIGINYNIDFYDRLHELHPDKPVTGPEAAACSTVRGSYDWNKLKGHAGSYDDQYPSFGYSHRYSWQEAMNRDYISGIFYWTGMDYRGEAGWPSLNSSSGAIDMAGFPKDTFYLMKSMWVEEAFAHILPHWNWQGREGQECRVMVFSNGDYCKLYLNDEMIAEGDIVAYEQIEFMVSYQPGELKAIVTKDGQPHCEKAVRTTKSPAKLVLECDNDVVLANDEDVAVLRGYFVDEDGLFVPDINLAVDVKVNSACGEIIMDSGNPTDTKPYHTSSRNMFNGLVRIFVKSLAVDEDMVIDISCDGYDSKLVIVREQPARRAHVKKIADRIAIGGFRLFPIYDDEPELLADYPEDQNTSNPIDLLAERPEFLALDGTKYALYKCIVQLPGLDDDKQKASVLLSGIDGEIKVMIRHHSDPWPAPSPEEFLTLTGNSDGKSEMLFDLAGFKSKEKIVIHVVLKILDQHNRLKSAKWIIENK